MRSSRQPPAGPRSVAPGHPAGALGIIHPFPTLLVSVVVAGLAVLAGGTGVEIALLTVAMLGFQSSIGATNDLADQERDTRVGAAKPLPAGQLSRSAARAVAVAGGAVGLTVSASMGPAVLIVGALGYLCGIGYDLRLRRSGRGWIAFAVAFPSLLAWTWLGAAGSLPPAWPALLPMAAAIGPALHLSNSLIDFDTDAADPTGGLAGRLGRTWSLIVLASLLAVVHALAWLVVAATGYRRGATSGEGMAVVILALLVSGLLAALGVTQSAARDHQRRVAGWMIQAVATALLAVAMVASFR